MNSAKEAMIRRMMQGSPTAPDELRPSGVLESVKTFLAQASTHPPPAPSEICARTAPQPRLGPFKLKRTGKKAYFEMNILKIPIEERKQRLIEEIN